MVLKTPSALVLVLALLALALVLAACGGGSTAGPIAATTDAPTSPAPAATAPAQPATPPVTQTPAQSAPTPAPSTTPQANSGHAQPSGGASAPDASSRDGASAGSSDSSAAAADEPSPAPTATTPRTEQPAADEPDPDPEPAGSLLDETAELTLVNRVSPAHYFQTGTVTGTYDGTMEVEARITSQGVLVRFTATLPGGTISGRGVAIAILDSATWPALRGTAAVTGGTGRFADIKGRRLSVTGRARPDASKARVRLFGTVKF